MWGTDEEAGVLSNGANTKIINCKISSTDEECVSASGDNFLIKKTKLKSCSSGCLFSDGANAQILNNKAWICENDPGIEVDGNGSIIKNNEVTGSENECFDVDADNVQVIDNKASGCSTDGFLVNGVSPTVSGNTATAATESGFDVSATTSLMVHNNKATYCNDILFDLDCSSCTGDSEITENVAKHSVEDDDGFEISADGGNILVKLNKALYIQDFGFDIEGAATFSIIKNVVNHVGGDEGESGIDVRSSANGVVKGNKVSNVFGDGYYFSDITGFTISNNTSDMVDDSGFYLTGTSGSNTFDNNTADMSLDYGFYIGSAATNTTVTNNTATTNNTDYCDNGTGTTESGNDFKELCP
jgi:parallel beta-helix repeat protein